MMALHSSENRMLLLQTFAFPILTFKQYQRQGRNPQYAGNTRVVITLIFQHLGNVYNRAYLYKGNSQKTWTKTNICDNVNFRYKRIFLGSEVLMCCLKDNFFEYHQKLSRISRAILSKTGSFFGRCIFEDAFYITYCLKRYSFPLYLLRNRSFFASKELNQKQCIA